MDNQIKKDNRGGARPNTGGARPGAGRKKKSTELLNKSITAQVSETEYNTIKELSIYNNKTVSMLVRDAILLYIKNKS